MEVSKYSKMFQIEAHENKEGRICNASEVLAFLVTNPLKSGSLLDVGCGKGKELQKYCEERQIKYYGIDLEFVPKSSDYQLGDMHDLNMFSDKQFDNVCFFNSLEHSVAPFIALSEAYRVMNKDGLIFIGLPANTEGHDSSEAHFINLTNSQLKNLLIKAGFAIVTQTEGNMRFTVAKK